MDPVKGIYLKRHFYKFEDVWTERKFPMRNINDLNGFMCCLCLILPFSLLKAIIMSIIHLIIFVPVLLTTTIILFPYQLIMIYISTLSTVLLGPKIKFILFFTNWLMYSVFLLFYVSFAALSCIFFSFYAAFKVTLSDNYYALCGYHDPIKILFSNIEIYFTNNTKEFHTYFCQLKSYRLDQEQGEEIWDISLVSWCNVLMGIVMTLCAVIVIMSVVFVEIVIYFIPFAAHLTMNVYFMRFMRYFFGTCVFEQPCLALIALPFILLPIVLIPVFTVLYLVLYVWFFSAFFNKAIVMEAFIDNSFDCLQQWSYILNTVMFYNNTLLRYSFQSCWKCHCCRRREKQENDGYDLETRHPELRNKRSEKNAEETQNPYEIKFRQLCRIFADTKNNKELVTCGKIEINEENKIKRKQKENETKEQEVYRQKQMNIELWCSPKAQPKHKRMKHINSNSSTQRNTKMNTKRNGKPLNNTKKHKYTGVPQEESRATDEELDILVCLTDSDSNKPDEPTGFSYPRGI